MAAPEYVPPRATEDVRTYTSPPRRGDQWKAERPGDLGGEGQPHGERFGVPGPDQGYGLVLARRLHGKLRLAPGESEADALAAIVAVGLKRASLFGRAPVIHDLTLAATVWGLIDEHPPAELAARRTRLFAGVSHPHHYLELRQIVDMVPEEVLRSTPTLVGSVLHTKWSEWLMPLDHEAHSDHH